MHLDVCRRAVGCQGVWVEIQDKYVKNQRTKKASESSLRGVRQEKKANYSFLCVKL